MSAMEKSLRRALDAGDARDPAFRDSIYMASERALERLLAENPADAEMAHARRVLLAETINEIEAEYFAAFSSGEMQDVASDGAAPEVAAADDGDTMSVETVPFNREDEDRFIAESEASVSIEEEAIPSYWTAEDNDVAPAHEDGEQPQPSPSAGVDWSPKKGSAWRAVPKGPTRLGIWGPVIIVVLCAILAGIYFVYGAVFTSADGSTGAAAAAESTTAQADWITVFDGKQLDVIATPAGGTVESVTVRGVPAVRIAPATKGGEINIAIGPGVVKEIQGQNVRVEIVAGSSDGAAREFGVRCLFRDQTVCARQRFQTAQSSESFVFDMAVPKKSSSAGVLAIDPALGTQAGDLDLYSVRMRALG